MAVQNRASTAAVRLRATATLTSMRLHHSCSATVLPPDETAGASATHHGVICDGCGSSPIVGVRHKRKFGNFDLCGGCMAGLAVTHPQQVALYTAVDQPPPSQRPVGYRLGGPSGWLVVPAGSEAVVAAAVGTQEWGHGFEFAVLEAELVGCGAGTETGGLVGDASGGGGGPLFAVRKLKL